MSNLTGSVDVVRERERRARLQLLDEYRDPSPQPIFGQPVKVELEDETSRRIKDTLGDFTQVQHVLINDPKHLIGIGRSGAAANAAAAGQVTTSSVVIHSRQSNAAAVDSGGGVSSLTWSSTRGSSGNSHPSANHSSNKGVPATHNSGKRPVPINGLLKPSSANAFDGKSSSRRPPVALSKVESGGEKKVHNNHHHHSNRHHPGPSKHHRVDHPPKANSIASGSSAPEQPLNQHREKDQRRSKNDSLGVPQAGANPRTPPQAAPPALQNGLVRKKAAEPNSKRSLAKYSIPKLSIPPQVDKGELSHFEVEHILKEMKQAVPPPLTAIQTPRTEDRGFSFVADVRKESTLFVKSSQKQENGSYAHEAVPLLSPGHTPPSKVRSPAKKSPSVSSPFNLQEDLEMSDSDDEENMVPSCKNPELSDLATCPKSSLELKLPTASNPMGVTIKVEPADEDDKNNVRQQNASSDSSDSDSEDSCSESNDSESASSSEASDLEAEPSKPAAQEWNLSNFFDETRRNHSPAFVAVDTNTNSSTAVKEESHSVHADKDFSLGDEDSDNCMSGKYYDRDLLQSPMDDLFSLDNGPISIKSEVLSPMSPITSPVPPPPIIIRGPRTPPTPPEEREAKELEQDDDDDVEELPRPPKASSEIADEVRHKSREKTSDDRHSRSKKKSTTKSKKASSPSPKGKSEHRSTPRELIQDASKSARKKSPGKSSHKRSSKRDNAQTQVRSETTSKSKTSSRHSEQDVPDSSREKSRESRSSEMSRTGPSDSRQRPKESHKSSHRTKSSSSKSSKPEVKRPLDKKKKSNKFSIKNFLQTPSDEQVAVLVSPQVVEHRRESSDESHHEEDEEMLNVEVDPVVSRTSVGGKQRNSSCSSSSSSSRSRSRSGSRQKEVPKRHNSNHKRPSSRSSDIRKKPRDGLKCDPDSDRTSSKSVHVTNPPPMVLPELMSPLPASKVESAIPAIVVSIPLSRLLRIPHLPRSSKDWTEELPSKELHGNTVLISGQRSSTSISASPSKKDFKTKHRTESSKSVGASSDKSAKNAKSDVISKGPPPTERKSSDVMDKGAKSSRTSDASSHTKKRKSDKTESEHPKKKPKISINHMSPKSAEAVQQKMKEKMPVVKIERMEKSDLCPQPERRVIASKRTERRGSTSSMCSQQSHKSSKSKKEKRDSSKESQESKTKNNTVLLTAKEIKKEKEEKPPKIIGVAVKMEKVKPRTKEKIPSNECKKLPVSSPCDSLTTSSQINYWDGLCKLEDAKAQAASHQRMPIEYGLLDAGSDWERFAPDIQQELKGLPSHLNKGFPGPMAYYYTEGKKLKHLAAKETDPIQQALKYFEATVMFVLTSLHRELSNKDPDSIYQMYKDTLRFTHVIRSGIQKHQSHSMPGNIDFKILILCLKCQSLLHLKLYGLKIKEVKEQHKGVSDFMHSSSNRLGSHTSPQPMGSSSHSRNLSQPSPCQPRVAGSVPSPHSPTPSPAGSVASVGSQSSGYSSSEVNGNNPSRPHGSLQLPHIPQPGSVIGVPQTMFDVMAKHHTHLSNLHMCHELWEQADMYMTRSNSKEFFREVAEKSERLSLHSNIKDLVSYLQTGLSLLKDC